MTKVTINRKLKAGALRYLKRRLKDSDQEVAAKALAAAVEHYGDDRYAKVTLGTLQKRLAHEQKVLRWLIAQTETPRLPLHVTYDAAADAAYLYLREVSAGEAAQQRSVLGPTGATIVLDFDQDDQLLGLEVLCAHTVLPLVLLESATPTTSATTT